MKTEIDVGTLLGGAPTLESEVRELFARAMDDKKACEFCGSGECLSGMDGGGFICDECADDVADWFDKQAEVESRFDKERN